MLWNVKVMFSFSHDVSLLIFAAGIAIGLLAMYGTLYVSEYEDNTRAIRFAGALSVVSVLVWIAGTFVLIWVLVRSGGIAVLPCVLFLIHGLLLYRLGAFFRQHRIEEHLQNSKDVHR
jgi:hypothetical protein